MGGPSFSSCQQVEERFSNHVWCGCVLCDYQPCTGSVCHLWHCCCSTSNTSSGGRSCSCVNWWLWMWLWMQHLHHLCTASSCVHHLRAASSCVHHLHAASSCVQHLHNTNLRRMWMPLMGCRSCVWTSHGSS